MGANLGEEHCVAAAAEQNLSQRSRWCRWKIIFAPSARGGLISTRKINYLRRLVFAFATQVSWVCQFTAAKRQNLVKRCEKLSRHSIYSANNNFNGTQEIRNWKWWFWARADHNLKLWLITRCDREGGGQKWSISIGPRRCVCQRDRTGRERCKEEWEKKMYEKASRRHFINVNSKK